MTDSVGKHWQSRSFLDAQLGPKHNSLHCEAKLILKMSTPRWSYTARYNTSAICCATQSIVGYMCRWRERAIVIPRAISEQKILRKGESNSNDHMACGTSMMDVSLMECHCKMLKWRLMPKAVVHCWCFWTAGTFSALTLNWHSTGNGLKWWHVTSDGAFYPNNKMDLIRVI